MKPLRMMVLFVFAMVAVGCQERVVIGDNGQLPAADAAPIVCVTGAQVACTCLNDHQGVQVCNDAGTGYDSCQCPSGHDAGIDVADSGQDAQPETGTDAPPAKKTCLLKKDVYLAEGDPSITSAANLDGFAVGYCEVQGSCHLTIVGKNEGPVVMAQPAGGEFGFLVYGAPHGYLISYSGMTDAGLKYHTSFISDQGAESLVGELSSFAFGMAPSEDGGYWFGENSIGELLPEGNTSTAMIRYMSPQNAIGSPVILAQNTVPSMGQNQVVGLATIGKTIAASVTTAADDLKRNTAAFLIQPDGTTVKVVLDTYVSGYDVSAVHSAPGNMISQNNRFAMTWAMMSDPNWKNYLTFMNPDGSGQNTIEIPASQAVTPVGDLWAGVENDQVNLKISLTLFDENLHPVSDPLVVAQGMKTYYLSSPVARATASDEIAVIYTSQITDHYEIRAAIISCQ